jgi:hypothetical protein
MKLKRYIFSSIAFLGMINSSISISAFSSDDTKNSVSYIMEYEKALNEFTKSFDGKLDDEKFYTCYSLDGLHEWSLSGVYEANSFEELIKGRVKNYVQVGTQLIAVIEIDGKLTAFVETQPMGYKSVVELSKEETKLREQIDEDIADVKYCGYQGFGCIHLSVIYFKTASGKEYVVPYIDNYNCGNEGGRFDDIMENGKIYTGKEFIEIAKKIVPDLTDLDPNVPVYDGGLNTGILGDVDGNYKVDVRDCSRIAKALAKGYVQSLHDTADYNKDKKKDVRDAAAIAKDLAEK